MEATGEQELLKIRAPRLEDAGLEDCALSPKSIKEAFFKAANSLRSRASSILTTTAEDEEDDAKSCIDDPGPSEGKLSDTLLGLLPAAKPPGSCSNEKGGGFPQLLGDDDVVVAGGDSLSDEEGQHRDIRVLGKEVYGEGKACVDELQDLKIKEEVDQKDRDEDEEDEGPILAETYV